MEKSNGSTLFTGGRDSLIRVFNARNAKQVGIGNSHRGWIFDIVGIGEDAIASTGYDETIQIYNLPSDLGTTNNSEQENVDEEDEEEGEGEEDNIILNSNQEFKGHHNTVRCLTSFPWHKLVCSAGDDKLIKVWNLKKSKCVKTIKKMHRDSVKDIAQVGKNCFVSGSDDQTVLKWSLKKLRKPIRSLSLTSFVSKLLYHHEKNLIFVAMSNCIGVLDQNLKIVSRFVHERPVTSLCFDDEHNVLIAGDRKGFVTMWDLRKSETRAYHNSSHSDYVTGIAVLNNEEYITTSLQRPNSLKYWKFQKTKCTKDIKINCDGVWSMFYCGEQLKKEISEIMRKDVEERVNWLIEESDEESDDVIIDKAKLQFFNKHMFVSKVFLMI